MMCVNIGKRGEVMKHEEEFKKWKEDMSIDCRECDLESYDCASCNFEAGYKASEQFYDNKIKKLEQDLEIAKALVLTSNKALDLTKEYIKNIADRGKNE